MADIITVKIDMTKVDEARFFQGKNGARWLDLVLIPTKDSRYGESHMVKQQISKEERQAKVQLPIIGNAKVIWSDDKSPRQQQQQQPRPPQPAATESYNDEDVPF